MRLLSVYTGSDASHLRGGASNMSGKPRPLHSALSRRAITCVRPGGTIRFIVLCALVSLGPRLLADDVAVNLPDGVKDIWEIAKAYHETTPTRSEERRVGKECRSR